MLVVVICNMSSGSSGISEGASTKRSMAIGMVSGYVDGCIDTIGYVALLILFAKLLISRILCMKKLACQNGSRLFKPCIRTQFLKG